MKITKTMITILLAGLMALTGLRAQTVQEGVNHLYAERYRSAKETFDKLVATNPNNLEAVYWLGQTYIAMQDIKSARDLYSKTLQANGNAPLILAGMGHVNLIDGKKDEARQMFETAINLSTGKKGADVSVLNAIGRANVDAKEGDIAYAIDKLKLAVGKDPKNADVLLNLGDAYRKAHEGGQAVMNYDQALQTSPSLARAVYRKGMIYYTQRNWELFEQLMKQAISIDSKFAPAFYQLYYYYLGKLDFTTAQDYATKFIATTDQDPQNDYLRIQTLWAQKKYDEAISGAKALLAAAGQQTQPKVYKLLADSYVSKGDTSSAKQYVDEYFSKQKEEDIIPTDYILRGQVYGATTGDDKIILDSYVKAADMITEYSDKKDLLDKAISNFEAKRQWCPAAELRTVLAKARKTPLPTDPFFIGLRYYQCGNYQRADSALKAYIVLAPDTLFGHYYRAKTMYALDTTMMVEPYASTMVQEYRKTLDLSQVDKIKFKNQAIESSKLLAGYFNNIKKNKDSAIFYLQKGLEFDPTNASIQELIDYLKKTPKSKTGTKPAGAVIRPKPDGIKSSAVRNKSMAVPKA
ncbi:MAG TPA: tetratricopeptide repeat protein [Chitinophagaceae bacterium]|nr:tetratricopeptide repeat protein [Chitinophagaceae bacterium]